MELALQIRQRRKEKNLFQDDLAQRIYVSRQTVSNWERDKDLPGRAQPAPALPVSVHSCLAA